MNAPPSAGLLLLLAAGCPRPAAGPVAPRGDADLLVSWLTGTFTTRAQAAADDRVPEVVRSACPVTWSGGRRALYVEQSLPQASDEPVAQRLYLVGPGEAGIRMEVFALEDPAAARGTCADPRSFDPDTAARRLAGCALGWSFAGDAFVGGTRGTDCETDIPRAHHAEAEMRVEAGRMLLWERAFDADGVQVDGPETGAYELLRAE